LKLPNILIVGKSGSGKSSSLRNLDRNTTWILDLENKALPFRNAGFKHLYTIPADFKQANEWGTIIQQFRQFMLHAANSNECSCVVIESFRKWDEALIEYQKSTNTGFHIYNEHNKYVMERLNEFKYWPVPIIWLGLDDVVEIETVDPQRPMRRACLNVFGKQWEGSIEKEFEMVLFTHQTVDKGKPKYWFKTNNIGECSAKTPMGMFDDILVDNDLEMVLSRMVEYYRI
jgi:hypothetical protein